MREIEIYVRPINSHDGVYLELRRVIHTPEGIRKILEIALHEEPVILRITFKNKPMAILKLANLGLLPKDLDVNFYTDTRI
jgi:hypothetical protein